MQIAGNGRYFDQSGSTTVTVQNVAATPFTPGLLFYDDDPERISQEGVLFRGSVTATAPARLYYYHDADEQPHRLVVALSSASADPASVQLVDVVAGPNLDVMHVGHTVTKNFLLTKSRGEGIVVNLSRDEPFLLADIAMASRQTVSGTVDLRVISGRPGDRHGARRLGRGQSAQPARQGRCFPATGTTARASFTIGGFGSSALNYAAGSPNATVVIGDADPTPPSADAGATGHDYGDYGVSHTIDVTLNDPGHAPATAYLYIKPLAGKARGSYLDNRELVEDGCVRAPTPYQISVFELTPGQSYHAVVQTMTEGGSFYPVEIGVTGTPPQPRAPPINAPDGCFPKPSGSSLTP